MIYLLIILCLIEFIWIVLLHRQNMLIEKAYQEMLEISSEAQNQARKASEEATVDQDLCKKLIDHTEVSLSGKIFKFENTDNNTR